MTNTKTIKSSKSKDNKVIAEKDLPVSKVTEEVEVPYEMAKPKSLKDLIHNKVKVYLNDYDQITVSDAVTVGLINVAADGLLPVELTEKFMAELQSPSPASFQVWTHHL